MLHYPDLGSAFDWLNQISQVAQPIRCTTQIWVISMELLRSLLRRHLTGKPVVTSPNVGCFLRLSHNLTLVSNICEAVLRSLLWAPNKLKKLPEVGFQFPFNLIGKSTMAFLIGQSWCVVKSWYTGRCPDQGSRHYFADRLSWRFSLVSGAS